MKPSFAMRGIKPRSIAEVVTDEIRRSILSGTLKPGQEFLLRNTADRLGVSTQPVRDAVRVLQTEGLIIARRARSAVVAPMDISDLEAIYALRRLIEPPIASRAVTVMTAADLGRADRAMETLANKRLGLDEVWEHHRDFHFTLLRPGASAWEIRILETLWYAAERYLRIGFKRRDANPEEPDRRSHAHVELLGAFRNRDPGEVTAAVLTHLNDNERLAKSALTP